MKTRYLMWRSAKSGGSSVFKALKRGDGVYNATRHIGDGQFMRRFEADDFPSDRDLIMSGHCLKMVCDAGLPWRLPQIDLYAGLSRNPFSRFISGWLYAQRKGWIPRDTCPIEVATTYTEGKSQGWADWKRRRAWNQTWLHTCHQPMWTLYDQAGHLAMDMVLRQESLQGDFDKFRDRIGRPRLTLPHRNANPGERPWREWYAENPGLKEVVADLMAPSLEAMGYVYEQDEAGHDCVPQATQWGARGERR